MEKRHLDNLKNLILFWKRFGAFLRKKKKMCVEVFQHLVVVLPILERKKKLQTSKNNIFASKVSKLSKYS